MKEKFNDSIFWKSYLYYENRSGSVHLFVCPFVCNATSFSILDRMGQQIYLWNPHVKSQVLRHFWSHSEEKQKSLPFCPHHLSIYLYYENSSGSVRLFVRPYVRTSSTFLDLIRLAQNRYLWIPYKKGQVLRHFWSNSEERKEFSLFAQIIYLYYENRCLSVHLFVRPCVRTLSIPSFFVQFNPKGLLWMSWVFYDSIFKRNLIQSIINIFATFYYLKKWAML